MKKIMVVGNNPAFLIDEEKETVEELDTVSSNIDWVYISPVDTVVEYMHKGKLIMVPVKKGQIIYSSINIKHTEKIIHKLRSQIKKMLLG